MNRRQFTTLCLGAGAVLGSVATTAPVPAATGPNQGSGAEPRRKTEKRHIAFLLYDGMTALDLIGPAQTLTLGGQFDVDYVWRDAKPILTESKSARQLAFVPTATFADIRETDILVVPGTSNPYAQITQPDIVEWVATVGKQASWVTSVCSGAFLLGAAGLLKGYKATTHWALVDELAFFGATPTRERVVSDRNRVTGAGVTSGIDFGLTLLAKLCGDDAAKATQLLLEYDPAPPYKSGSPRTADAALVATSRENYAAMLRQTAPYARQSLEEAAARLGVTVPGNAGA